MIQSQQLPVLNEIFQKTLGWQPDREQQEKFQQLYEEILLGNRQLNLTRIVEPQEFWEKHIWDSLAGLKGLDISLESIKKLPIKVIDIGTGAGFPGIPIAIVLPFWTVTLLDSTRKKIKFLDDLIIKLNLKNTQTIVGRVEEIGQNALYRTVYDLAVIRAVSEASVCAEYALPLLKIDGLAILYRGHWSDRDRTALEPTVEKLGGKIESEIELVTPLGESIRNCIYLRKVAPTPPQFPRAIGIPAQKPL
jgi:16S rRNA (guanine527-N7)-methyltransferase